jgi:hypothetical protein
MEECPTGIYFTSSLFYNALTKCCQQP